MWLWDVSQALLLALPASANVPKVNDSDGVIRVEPWPKNGVPRCLVDRFLQFYYNTHHGIRGKPHPACSTMITVERQLGMAALRESDFDGRLVRRCVRVRAWAWA